MYAGRRMQHLDLLELRQGARGLISSVV